MANKTDEGGKARATFQVTARGPRAGRSLRDLRGPWLNANIGWAGEISGAYILGYRRAAEALTAHLASHPHVDTLVFPILFLWRHTIELQLKVIIVKAGNLAGTETRWPKGHSLDELWCRARKALNHVGLGEAFEFPAVESIISELATFDPYSDGFRYHERPNGRRTLEGAPDTIDLSNTCEMIAGITNFLDCTIAGLEARLTPTFC